VSHVEHWWEAPPITRFMQRLASFSRLILFDKRETGLSDRVAGIATLEERMDDVRAVMDTVGSEQAAVFGISEGGPMSILFAATYPERTSALEQGWGTCCTLPRFAPSFVEDAQFRHWWARFERSAPAQAR
jgi:pimeloyl-ACP methyl ester carboxylesterase